MSGRRRTIFFLVMLLAVLVLLTGQVRGEDRRSLGPLGTGVLTALAPLQTVMARAVVPAEGAVGRVIETTPFTARVLLLSDPRSAVGVILQHSREIGVVEGNGQGDLQIKYLSRASAVPPGDIVITSGQGGVFPRGIVVGRLQTLHAATSGGVFREGTVRAAVDLGRLEEVLILLPAGGPRH